jgi:hypothetical protein
MERPGLFLLTKDPPTLRIWQCVQAGALSSAFRIMRVDSYARAALRWQAANLARLGSHAVARWRRVLSWQCNARRQLAFQGLRHCCLQALLLRAMGPPPAGRQQVCQASLLREERPRRRATAACRPAALHRVSTVCTAVQSCQPIAVTQGKNQRRPCLNFASPESRY